MHLVDFDNLYGRCVAGDDDRVASLVCHLFLVNRPLLEAGLQLSVVRKKLNVVADGGRRKRGRS